MIVPNKKCKYCGKEEDPRKMIGVVPAPTETGYKGESFYYCMDCGEEKGYLHIKED